MKTQLERIQFYLNKEGFDSCVIFRRGKGFGKTWQEDQQMQGSFSIYLVLGVIPYHFETNSAVFLSGGTFCWEKNTFASPKKTSFASFKANALNFSEIKKGDLLVGPSSWSGSSTRV